MWMQGVHPTGLFLPCRIRIGVLFLPLCQEDKNPTEKSEVLTAELSRGRGRGSRSVYVLFPDRS